MLKSLYDKMVSSLLYYKKFCNDIESIGCQVNPNYMCAKLYKFIWHVDDVKSIYEDSKVNIEFLDWLKDKYENDNIGEVRAKGVLNKIIWKWHGLYYSWVSQGEQYWLC